MPKVYLSPSMQPYNLYNGGGNEQYYMNLIADAMEPYMISSGIQFTRNDPSTQTLPQVIKESNAGNYDLHVALHSNAAPEHLAGQLQGTDVYYNPNNRWSRKFADFVAENFRVIYPDPEKVDVLPTYTLAEVKNVNAPSVLIEMAYHDNPADAQWIRDNIELIAKSIVLSMTEYFGIPFVPAQKPRVGVVKTGGSNLNLRSHPSLFARVITRMPNNSRITVYGKTGDWYVVGFGDQVGYASAKYIG